MEFKKPIKISFLDFFKTGKFNHIELGHTKEYVLGNFPDPDNNAKEKTPENDFDIWTYGDVELHFEKQQLFLIYSDRLERLDSGNKLMFDKWIFRNAQQLSLSFVLKELNKHNIDYKKETDSLRIAIRLASGIELSFENIHDIDNLDPNEYLMTSFGLIKEEINKLV